MKTFLIRFTILSAAFLVVFVAGALAGNGKITGRVTDAETGSPIPGANVLIQGTTLGAAADVDGKYYILNVPPGTYDLVASAVGYVRSVIRNARVGSDQIVTVDVSLRPEAVGLEEVVIEAESRVVDPSQTSAKTSLAASDFRDLPLRDTYDLVRTAPSVYRGFVRGGKQFETKTLIEGIDLTDQFFAYNADNAGNQPYLTYNGVTRQQQAGTAALVNVNVTAVEEANVLTGGVGADYSSSTAGIISYSLREGRGPLSGRLRARVSNLFRDNGGLKHFGPEAYNDANRYATEKATLAASTVQANKDKAARYTWTPGKYEYGEKPTTLIEGSLGGGMFENAGFYFTGSYYNSYGRFPNEFTRKVNSSLKLTHSPSSDLRFNVVGLLEDRGRLLGWKNNNYADDFRFFLEGVPRWDGMNLSGSVKMTHVLSPGTYYEVQIALVTDNFRQGYIDGNNDGFIGVNEDGDFLRFADTAQVNRYAARTANSEFTKFFSPTPRNESGSETSFAPPGGGPWKISRPGLFYEDFTNTNITLRGDITSQLTTNHQLRGGFQVRLHDLDRELRAGYIGGVFPAYKNYVDEVWNLKPKEYSLYLQDRMEYAGLIINLGARLDVFDLAASEWSNFFAPFVDTKDAAGGDVRIPVRGPTIDRKVYISPRLGVSHPISENAAMYFSFSRQTQLQPFSSIFVNYNDFGNPSLPNIVPVDQEPRRSTNYDLGIQWSFAEGYGLDANAYFRDIGNYGKIGFSVTPRAPWRNYFLTTSFGYADSRGVEVTLRKTLEPVVDFLSVGGRASYAYSYIKQAEFTGGNQTAFSTLGGDSLKFKGELPFEDLKNFNTIERNIRGANSSITGGYDRQHRFTYTLLLRFPEDITLSSVGRFESGFFFLRTLGDPRARELDTGPWNKQVDFRLEKLFRIGRNRISVYVDLLNAFNTQNILAYDNSPTGQTEWERTGNPTGVPADAVGNRTNRPITRDGSMIYDIPREFYFGVNFEF